VLSEFERENETLLGLGIGSILGAEFGSEKHSVVERNGLEQAAIFKEPDGNSIYVKRMTNIITTPLC